MPINKQKTPPYCTLLITGGPSSAGIHAHLRSNHELEPSLLTFSINRFGKAIRVKGRIYNVRKINNLYFFILLTKKGIYFVSNYNENPNLENKKPAIGFFISSEYANKAGIHLYSHLRQNQI
jgi:hypothetical protein